MQIEKTKHKQQISQKRCKYLKTVSYFMIDITGYGYFMQLTIKIIKLRI